MPSEKGIAGRLAMVWLYYAVLKDRLVVPTTTRTYVLSHAVCHEFGLGGDCRWVSWQGGRVTTSLDRYVLYVVASILCCYG